MAEKGVEEQVLAMERLRGNENTSRKEQLRDYRGYILRRECFYYASSKERKKHFEEIRNRGRRELLQIH